MRLKTQQISSTLITTQSKVQPSLLQQIKINQKVFFLLFRRNHTQVSDSSDETRWTRCNLVSFRTTFPSDETQSSVLFLPPFVSGRA